jgi:hypothetical protein
MIQVFEALPTLIEDGGTEVFFKPFCYLSLNLCEFKDGCFKERKMFATMASGKSRSTDGFAKTGR